MTSKVVRRVFDRFGRTNGSLSYSACRSLLSEAYKCKEAWQQRLQVPLLQKVDVGNFALAVQGKLDKEDNIQALDMDILANKLEEMDPTQLDFAQNLFFRFRHTNESLKMGESTPYALIRALLEVGETDRLLAILQDKVNYGIFLNFFTANILMDHFIESSMYKEAAFIAYDLMLQEDLSHPLCRHLAWYSCHLRQKNWPTDEDSSQAEEEAEDEEDIEYVRVQFITNPWYDDHFDINRESLLLGKTMVAVTKGDESTLGRSYHLIGLGLYEKFDRGLELLKDILDHKDESFVCLHAIETFERSLESVVNREPPEEEKPPGTMTLEDVMPHISQIQKEQLQEQLQNMKAELHKADRISSSHNMEGELLKRTKATVMEHATLDIQEQDALFVEWERKREVELQEQLTEAQLQLKKENIIQRLLNLQECEERLSYFDEVDKINLKMKGPPAHESIMRIQEEEQYVNSPGERGKIF